MPSARVKTPQAEELRDLDRLLDSGLVTRFGVAVDGGAHIGGWTLALARRFRHVHAFEPAPDTFATLRVMTCGLSNTSLYRVALLAEAGQVEMVSPPGVGAQTARYARVQPDGCLPRYRPGRSGPDCLRLPQARRGGR